MFRIWFNDDDQFHVCFGDVIKIADMDFYEGPYEVTPKAYQEQVLETKNLAMSDDVTVHEIPYYETPNLFDGKTIYIANEV